KNSKSGVGTGNRSLYERWKDDFGTGKKSLYERWKDDYNDNPYDDDKECEDLMEEQLALVFVVKFGSNVL
ncbi:hypothetical protein Tco_1171141, partial [Tanacetum coccineum]